MKINALKGSILGGIQQLGIHVHRLCAHDILLQGNAIQCERDEVLLEEF